MRRKIILSIIVVLSISALSVFVFYFTNKTEESEPQFIYVNTQKSQQADAYASKNVYRKTISFLEPPFHGIPTIQLGHGISVENPENEDISETYFYPVFVDQEFRFVLRVVAYKTEGYEGYLSAIDVDELKSLRKVSDYHHPISLYQSNGCLAYYSDTENGVLSCYPSDNRVPNEETLLFLKNQNKAKSICNMSEITDLDVWIPKK